MAYAAAHGLPRPRPGREARDGRGGGGDSRRGRDGREPREAREGGREGGRDGRRPPPPPQTPQPAGDPALQGDGYQVMLKVFERPGAVIRWPLYLRQAKAVLRAGDEDVRRAALRLRRAGRGAAVRPEEGLFRLDRDRQGVLRVYPGQILQRLAEGQPREDTGSSAPAGPLHAADAPAPIASASAVVAPEPMEPEVDAVAATPAEAAPARQAKRRAGAAKKAAPAPAKKAAAKPRAAKAPAPKKRARKTAAGAAD